MNNPELAVTTLLAMEGLTRRLLWLSETDALRVLHENTKSQERVKQTHPVNVVWSPVFSSSVLGQQQAWPGSMKCCVGYCKCYCECCYCGCGCCW